jgi:ABC-type antimicrobial peptide transport system permease subunit
VLFEVRTMEQIVSIWLATRRFAMALLGVFAILALVLSAIGIYGVISYMIGQRRREIGIRMALGAQPVDILRLVLEHGGRLTLMGIFLGGLGSLLLARLMQSLIYGISTADPITFAIVVFLLAFVALMACYIPARRASATDPLIVLRSE